MSKPLPASRRQRIDTTHFGIRSGVVLLPGPVARLMVELKTDSWRHGYVKTCDVLKLRDMCEAILERRALEKRKP
jgi:hypothetical protein